MTSSRVFRTAERLASLAVRRPTLSLYHWAPRGSPSSVKSRVTFSYSLRNQL